MSGGPIPICRRRFMPHEQRVLVWPINGLALGWTKCTGKDAGYLSSTKTNYGTSACGLQPGPDTMRLIGGWRAGRVSSGGGVASRDAGVKPPGKDARRPPPEATRPVNAMKVVEGG
jgi:hypothetical protein